MRVEMGKMHYGNAVGYEKGCGEAHKANLPSNNLPLPTMSHACFKHRDIAVNKRHKYPCLDEVLFLISILGIP